MNVCALDTLARAREFETVAAAIELRPWEWDFLHAVDGSATVGAISTKLGIDLDSAVGFVHEAQHRGLLDVVTMSLGAYRSRKPATVATPLAAAAAAPLDEPSAVAHAGAISFSSDAFDWNAPDPTEDDASAEEPSAQMPGAPENRYVGGHVGTASEPAPFAYDAHDAGHAREATAPPIAYHLGPDQHELPGDLAHADPEPDHTQPSHLGNGAAHYADTFADPSLQPWEPYAPAQEQNAPAGKADPMEHLVTWHNAAEPAGFDRAPSEAMHAPSEAMHAPSDAMYAPSDAMHAPSDAMHAPSDAMYAPSEADAVHVPSDAMHVPSDAMHVPSDAAHLDPAPVSDPHAYDAHASAMNAIDSHAETGYADVAHAASDDPPAAHDVAAPTHLDRSAVAPPYANGHSAEPGAFETAARAQTRADEGNAASISFSFSNDEPLEDGVQSYEPAYDTTPRLVTEHLAHATNGATHAVESATSGVSSDVTAGDVASPTYAMDEHPAAASAPAPVQSWKESLSWREQQDIRAATEAGREKDGVINNFLRALGVR